MRAIAVDDEKLALESLAKKLAYIERIKEVHTFLSPQEAIDFFLKNGADIAFLDISMARMNGLDLAARLREIKPGILILFVTGYSDYALDAIKLHADGYLMKPIDEADIDRELDALEKLRMPPKIEKPIRVQCFGDFEIFANGAPVTFTRSKSKEYLAYLVDRRGAKCTAAQIAAIIWDDGVYDRQRQKLISVIRADMIKALKKAGIEEMIKSDHDGISVVAEAFECDYYLALDGDIAARDSFGGEYMHTFSWGESTAANLSKMLRK